MSGKEDIASHRWYFGTESNKEYVSPLTLPLPLQDGRDLDLEIFLAPVPPFTEN